MTKTPTELMSPPPVIQVSLISEHYRPLPPWQWTNNLKRKFVLVNAEIQTRVSIHEGRSTKAIVGESRVPRRSVGVLDAEVQCIDVDAVGASRSIKRRRILKPRVVGKREGKLMNVEAWGSSSLESMEMTSVSNKRVKALLRKLPLLKTRGIERVSSLPPSPTPQISREIDWSRQEEFWRQVKNSRSELSNLKGKEKEVRDFQESDIQRCVCPGAWITDENTPDAQFSTTPPSKSYEEVHNPQTKNENHLIEDLRKSTVEARKLRESRIKEKQLEISMKGKLKGLERSLKKISWDMGPRGVPEQVWNKAVAAQDAAASPKQTTKSRGEFPFPEIGKPEKLQQSKEEDSQQESRDLCSSTSNTPLALDLSAKEREPCLAEISKSNAERIKRVNPDECYVDESNRLRSVSSMEEMRQMLAGEVACREMEDRKPKKEVENKTVPPEEREDDVELDACSRQDSPESTQSIGSKTTPTSLPPAFELFHSAKQSLARLTSSRPPGPTVMMPTIDQLDRNPVVPTDRNSVFKVTVTAEDDPILERSPMAEKDSFVFVTDYTSAQSARGKSQDASAPQTPDHTLANMKITISISSSPISKLRAAQSALRATSPAPSYPSSAAPGKRNLTSPFPPITPTLGFGQSEKASPSSHDEDLGFVHKNDDDVFGIDDSRRDNGRYDSTQSEDEMPHAAEYKKASSTRRLGFGKMKQLKETSLSLQVKMQGGHVEEAEPNRVSFFKSLRKFGEKARRRVEEKGDPTKKDNASTIPEEPERMTNIEEKPDECLADSDLPKSTHQMSETSSTTLIEPPHSECLAEPDSPTLKPKKVSEISSARRTGLPRSRLSLPASLQFLSQAQEPQDPGDEFQRQRSFSFTNTPSIIQTRKLSYSERPASCQYPKTVSKFQEARMINEATVLPFRTEPFQNPEYNSRLDAELAECTRDDEAEENAKKEEEKEEAEGAESAGDGRIEDFAESEEDGGDMIGKILDEGEWLANLRIGTARPLSLKRPKNEVMLVHVSSSSSGAAGRKRRRSNVSGEGVGSRPASGADVSAADSLALDELLNGNEPPTNQTPSLMTARCVTPPSCNDSSPSSPPSPRTQTLLPPRTDSTRTCASRNIDEDTPATIWEDTLSRQILQQAKNHQIGYLPHTESTITPTKNHGTIVVENPNAQALVTSRRTKLHKRVDSLIDPPRNPYFSKIYASSTGNLSKGNILDILRSKRHRRDNGAHEGRMRSSIQLDASDGEEDRSESVAATSGTSTSEKECDRTESSTNLLIADVRGGKEGQLVEENNRSVIISREATGKRERLRRFFKMGRN